MFLACLNKNLVKKITFTKTNKQFCKVLTELLANTSSFSIKNISLPKKYYLISNKIIV